ncbi:hypothetical protein OPV22_019127 [Ensete ventricosum]|uniref:Integrase catalytic domain-containing protein n=1 Tax=Ensete ventricosum TaxID=4639 RepID=A0AAV8R4V1_ENSVE|nr:hypothetical protein OPV22_019127 [Ensete ventricosum]
MREYVETMSALAPWHTRFSSNVTIGPPCVKMLRPTCKAASHARSTPGSKHQLMVPLTTADCAWPFAQWGMDLLGPFPPVSGQRRFLIVGVDYFTKWLEAEPLASITERQVEGFVWKNIITRFDLPRLIITDNETQFNNAKFKAFCQSYRIQLKFSPVAHPQTNGLAEVTNRAILERLKKRIFETSWVEELPSVL